MRKLLISAAIVSLIAGFSPALAQDREHQDQSGPSRGDRHGGEQRGEPQARGTQPQGAPPQAPAAAQPTPERGGFPRGDMRGRERGPENAMRGPREERPAQPGPNMAQPNQPPAPDNDRRDRERRFSPNNAMRGPAVQPNQPPAPNNAMRGSGRQYEPNNAMRGSSRDFSGVRNFHQNFRAERRFRAGPYMRPRGFYEHRWSWGEALPPLFWARQYWISDFEDYDLPPPPPGTVWVRVGDDALLIDQYSGTIIEVDYGIFY